MSFFLLLNKKEDIFKNVGKQMVAGPCFDFHNMKKAI